MTKLILKKYIYIFPISFLKDFILRNILKINLIIKNLLFNN
ncbi:hypothetical protein SAMN05421769_0779 [Chryseobacterium scophthalmum]|uniref:Uncharacterized protein n=1 Tax=Chryseobacterium scophthalmum TaxID=59733 RepID=A0A1N6EX86_9FLAO|nr:hypothetical protein SAMN05421769_0779 [Chryseobacterium scophthalmum]